MDRPNLELNMDSKVLREYYYLKEELVKFCRDNKLQTTGSKEELIDRIIYYLETGNKKKIIKGKKKKVIIDNIALDTLIEENFICSERHRKFFKKEIGNGFSFNVMFQNWLKTSAGKTYKDAINAYYKILEDKKNNKTVIDNQFEYNAYIRAFFEDNKDKTLDDAIKCWKYKKSLKGHNKYEKDDLKALDME